MKKTAARGGEAYREWVGGKIKDQVAAIEMDGGAEAPRGYGAGVDEHSLEMLNQIGKLLEKIGAGEIRPGGGGSDIQPLVRDGVAGFPRALPWARTISIGTTPKPTRWIK